MSDPKDPISTETHVIWSIRAVRQAIGVIGMLFPVVLVVGDLLLDQKGVRDAISDYYYSTSMHAVYLVFLLALSVLLIYYQYHAHDNIVTTGAGLLAIGVAVFPEAGSYTDPFHLRVDVVHHTCAVLFIASLGYVAGFLFMKPEAPWARLRKRVAVLIPAVAWLKWFRALIWSADDLRKTALTDEKKRRNRVYRVCGIVIAVCVVLVVAIHLVLPKPPFTLTLWLESAAVWSFAVAWLVKGELFLKDKAG